MGLSDITVVVVTFKSKHKIFSCIDSIPNNLKIIIVENSKHEILNQDTRTFVLSEIHYWFKENNLI